MSSGTNQPTVQSDAELRVITVKAEAGDNVKVIGTLLPGGGATLRTLTSLGGGV
jgi:hypothetical protein